MQPSSSAFRATLVTNNEKKTRKNLEKGGFMSEMFCVRLSCFLFFDFVTDAREPERGSSPLVCRPSTRCASAPARRSSVRRRRPNVSLPPRRSLRPSTAPPRRTRLFGSSRSCYRAIAPAAPALQTTRVSRAPLTRLTGAECPAPAATPLPLRFPWKESAGGWGGASLRTAVVVW